MTAKLKTAFLVFLLAAVVLSFVFKDRIIKYFTPKLQQIEGAAISAAINEIKKEVAAPPPLLVSPPAQIPATQILTRAGTIKWTNTQREGNNLPPLAENDQLDKVASLRLEDMFAKQYFAHVSLSGSGAEQVAGEVGYDYVALGENLAMGYFGSDEKLVDAWMASAGHRANILNAKYREIGVAVKKGIFEGKSTWIAVQIFGKPASACPQPDATLKTQIDARELQLNAMQNQLDSLKSEIDSDEPRNYAEIVRHNEKVSQYNTLVAQYNSLLGQVKAAISDYNAQVDALNKCVAG